MYSFKYDYSEGCCPQVLDLLNKTNFEQEEGYGEDSFSLEAKELIKKQIGAPDAEVHFISGGTQANLVVIKSILKSYEAVICVDTGHIHVNETGAVEATGHKIIAVENTEGKISAEQIQEIVSSYDHFPHVVKPKLVYISHSTELGTIYTKQELTDIYDCCRKNNLFLFIDGARLGSALTSKDSDLNLRDLPDLCDVFYIGGTKNGALLGEAIVICNKSLQPDFNFHLKQRGALLAKGRILGIQFLALFTDDLFLKNARHANFCAEKIAEAAKEKNFKFLTKPQTNQLFIILPYKKIQELQKNFDFYIWKKIDDEKASVRIITSWATPISAVEKFIEELKK